MESINHAAVHQVPWNKGKLVGQKAPLKQREIWAIRIRLQLKQAAKSAMSAKADELRLGHSSCSERRSGPSSSRSPNRLVIHCRVGCAQPT
jgi:hypothetical protein